MDNEHPHRLGFCTIQGFWAFRKSFKEIYELKQSSYDYSLHLSSCYLQYAKYFH